MLVKAEDCCPAWCIPKLERCEKHQPTNCVALGFSVLQDKNNNYVSPIWLPSIPVSHFACDSKQFCSVNCFVFDLLFHNI